MTGRNKNILVILLFIASLFISYKLAFSKTIQLKKQYVAKKEASLSTSQLDRKLFELSKQKIYNDSLLRKYRSLTSSSFQNNLLQSINILAKENTIKVLSFKEPHTSVSENTKFTNYQISLSGGYEDLLVLLNSIEEKYKFGKLLSVNFQKKKNYRTGQRFLVVSFVLQRVE